MKRFGGPTGPALVDVKRICRALVHHGVMDAERARKRLRSGDTPELWADVAAYARRAEHRMHDLVTFAEMIGELSPAKETRCRT